MKSLTSNGRSLRIAFTDLIIYGNLAFTFVFFSAAFDKGCNNAAASYRQNDLAVSQKSKTPAALSEKGQAKTAAVIRSAK